MERILLTTDFSDESKLPFPSAMVFAERMGLGITLAHVVIDLKTAPQGAALAPPQSPPSLGAEVVAARSKLQAIADQMQTQSPVVVEVLTGESVADTVAHYAETHDIAMIALSTHGRSGVSHLLFGSVAEEIVRASPVPVLSFPPRPEA
jgi:nucleotide-binding universal stress UspA family protein